LSRQPSPKSEADGAPSDEALSRIAREAVHQPADPRLDRQLERLGVMDAPEPVESRSPRPSSPSVASAAELERLNARLHRIEMTLWVLLAAVGIIALVEVILLLR
jgi:hypothetical protein